jgi:hypothetical protein
MSALVLLIPQRLKASVGFCHLAGGGGGGGFLVALFKKKLKVR